MVDVTRKDITERTATASTTVHFPEYMVQSLFPKLLENTAEKIPLSMQTDISTTKGAVITTAIIAGTSATKETSRLIPFCHPLSITSVKFSSYVTKPGTGCQVVIECTVKTNGLTGVEMEALVGASVAALTVYDMCKGLGKDIVIQNTQLVEKTGGKSDFTNHNFKAESVEKPIFYGK